MEERIPLEQASAREPTAEERRRRELTHLPYRAWCTACLKHRARQDQHRRTGKSHEHGCPTVSFDFCYVKASGSGRLEKRQKMVRRLDWKSNVERFYSSLCARKQDIC